MTLNAKIGGSYGFFGHFRLWKFISFTRWRHAADATRAYGRSVLWSRWAESKWYAIFETITVLLNWKCYRLSCVSWALLKFLVCNDNCSSVKLSTDGRDVQSQVWSIDWARTSLHGAVAETARSIILLFDFVDIVNNSFCSFHSLLYWLLSDLIALANLRGVSSKKGPLFVFSHNSLKWWSTYTKFLPVVAEEILIPNIATKYGSWLNILC